MSERFPVTPETREWVKTMALRIVMETYESYLKRKQFAPRTPEPNMTVARVTDALRQFNMPAPFEVLTNEKQSLMVLNELTKLVREGKLDTSIGEGAHGGEARCYEPVRK